MKLPSWLPLGRLEALRELSRDDAGGASAAERRRRDEGIRDTNTLSADEALAMVRAIRGKSLRTPLPDSTPLIRADRDDR